MEPAASRSLPRLATTARRALPARALAVGCAALVLACGRESEQPESQLVEPASARSADGQTNVEIREHAVTLRTRDGRHEVVSGSALERPAGFPHDVYLPAELRITIAGRSTEGFQILGQLPGPPSAAVARITREMLARGFVEQEPEGSGRLTPNQGHVRSFQQGGRRVLYIVIPHGERSELQLMTTGGG